MARKKHRRSARRARSTRRHTRRSTRRRTRRGYSKLLKKTGKCPAVIKRECKITKRGGQRCRVIAGSWRSKWIAAGKAQRSALNLSAKLKKRGCAPTFSTKLAGYRR